MPVYSDHAIAAYVTYFAKIRASHIFLHILAFSKITYFHICEDLHFSTNMSRVSEALR